MGLELGLDAETLGLLEAQFGPNSLILYEELTRNSSAEIYIQERKSLVVHMPNFAKLRCDVELDYKQKLRGRCRLS